jgi:4'-phosphopantetheinyl transferase
MKEATLKLIGTGISDDLKTAIDHQQYRYTTVERAQYIYTVCVKKVP